MANSLLQGLAGGARGLQQVLQLMAGQKFREQERSGQQEDALARLRERFRLEGDMRRRLTAEQGVRAERNRSLQEQLALAQLGVALPEARPNVQQIGEEVRSRRERAEAEALRSSLVDFAKEQAGKGLSLEEFAQVHQTEFGAPPSGEVLESFGALSAARQREQNRSRILSQRDQALTNLRALRVQGMDIEPYVDLYGLSPSDPDVQNIMSFEPQLGFPSKSQEKAIADAERRVRESGQFLYVSQEEVQRLGKGVQEDVAQQRAIMLEARRALRRQNPQAWSQSVSRAAQNEGSVPLADANAEAEAVLTIQALVDPNELLAIIATARDNPDTYADQGVSPEAVRRAAEDRLSTLNAMSPEEFAPVEPERTGVRRILHELGPGTLEAVIRLGREFDEAGRGGS